MSCSVQMCGWESLETALASRSSRCRKRGIRGQIGGQNLDGYVALQPRIAGAIHLAHATGAERRDNFVRTEFSPRREPHGLRAIIDGRAGWRGCDDCGQMVGLTGQSLPNLRLCAVCVLL